MEKTTWKKWQSLSIILFYILLYTSFVTNNYQVLGCYVLDYFYLPCHSLWQKYVSIRVDINLSTRAVLKITVQ